MDRWMTENGHNMWENKYSPSWENQTAMERGFCLVLAVDQYSQSPLQDGANT